MKRNVLTILSTAGQNLSEESGGGLVAGKIHTNSTSYLLCYAHTLLDASIHGPLTYGPWNFNWILSFIGNSIDL